ncbi:MAG: Gx transporter family protein [Proteobacteria bacterium]|nr:Gx transporter family protein [Pseudomonadota bacterium]
MPRKLTTTRDDHLIAWLTALAVTIHIAESALPSPLPGIKPGLANVVTIAVLIRYGWRMAAWVTLLRVLVSSLLLGSFLSPTFVLSLSGALCSALVLALTYIVAQRLPGAGLSALGYSVLAALAHMAGQFAVAYALFIPHPALLHLLPVLMSAAVIFGAVSGIIAQAMLTKAGA